MKSISGGVKTAEWEEYELLDAGGFERLERWGEYIFIRPEPQALWPHGDNPLWRKADGVYTRSDKGGGAWEFRRALPESWNISYKELTFKVRPTGFKHMGLFPEQALNWDKIGALLTGKKEVRALNLFGYTGAATAAAIKAGARVCHVDSSKGMLSWTKENLELSGAPLEQVRLIPEDAVKFLQREVKRGSRYDAVIMDPPSFGRGAKGEVWKIETDLWKLLTLVKSALTLKPLFILINSYTAGFSPLVFANMLASLELPLKNITYYELALPFRGSRLMPAGGSCWAE